MNDNQPALPRLPTDTGVVSGKHLNCRTGEISTADSNRRGLSARQYRDHADDRLAHTRIRELPRGIANLVVTAGVRSPTGAFAWFLKSLGTTQGTSTPLVVVCDCLFQRSFAGKCRKVVIAVEFVWLVPATGGFGLVAALLIHVVILRQPAGDGRVAEIADAIRHGAVVYLQRQYAVLAIVVVAIFLGMVTFLSWQAAFAFVLGAGSSAIAGAIGMLTATRANSRTAVAANSRGISAALSLAFLSGSVMGLTVGCVRRTAESGRAVPAVGFWLRSPGSGWDARWGSTERSPAGTAAGQCGCGLG